jgi:hypothetical protein
VNNIFYTQKTKVIKECLPQISVFAVVLVVYLWSMPRTVVLEDDGLFILAAYFNGIAHPPGYPLYTFLSHLFTWLPLGSIAYRVHMLSAIFGAFSCAILWWIVQKLIPGRVYAYTASLALGFSQVFWSQAIVAEVYTLNVLLILLLFVTALKYIECDDKNSLIVVMCMGFLYGLGLSNHWPLLILSTPMLLILMWPRWKRLLSQVVYVLPLILLGLLPYLKMVYISQMSPEISFYGPIDSWTDFWFFISREGYSELDQSPSAGWWDKWMFCGFVLKETVRQFGFVGFIFVCIGFLAQWRILPKYICISLFLGYVCNTFLLIGLLGFDYEFLHQNIFRVYPIIAYSVVSIWMVLGIKTLMRFINTYLGVQLRILPAMLSILILGIIFFINIKINYRAEDDWAEKYAKTILDNLPKNAVIFTDGDLDLSIIGYLNKVQNYREDVTVYSHKGILFSNRLFIPRKNTTNERAILIDNFLQTTARPVYYTYGLPHQYGVINYGLFKQIDKGFSSDKQIAYAIPEVVSYIKNIISFGEPDDPWEKMHYRFLLADYCNLSLLLMENSKQEHEKQELIQWVNIVCNTFHGYLRYAELLLSKQNTDTDKISKLIDKAQLLRNQIVFKSEAGMFLYLKGELNAKTGKFSKAAKNYNESYRLWPHQNNPALTKLQYAVF